MAVILVTTDTDAEIFEANEGFLIATTNGHEVSRTWRDAQVCFDRADAELCQRIFYYAKSQPPVKKPPLSILEFKAIVARWWRIREAELCGDEVDIEEEQQAQAALDAACAALFGTTDKTEGEDHGSLF